MNTNSERHEVLARARRAICSGCSCGGVEQEVGEVKSALSDILEVLEALVGDDD